MPTSISSIYDNLIDLVAAALPTYKRIPNPYIMDSNNQLVLSRGYGVAFGPGNRVDLHVGCRISYERIFNVMLVKLVTTTDHNVSARETLEKQLIEDFTTLRVALENDFTLSGQCIRVDYSSDSGIEFNASETLKFISINMDLLCLYEEILV